MTGENKNGFTWKSGGYHKKGLLGSLGTLYNEQLQTSFTKLKDSFICQILVCAYFSMLDVPTLDKGSDTVYADIGTISPMSGHSRFLIFTDYSGLFTDLLIFF